MKFQFIIILQVLSLFSFSQTRKIITQSTIEEKVNSIYLAKSVRIKSVVPFMNSDVEKRYKVSIYNGRSKKIVAVKLILDFNMLAQPDNNLISTQKFKVSIPPKSTETVICKNIESSFATTPTVVISMIVYSDGTYEANDAGLYSSYKEGLEKDAIRKKLLTQFKNKP